MKTDEIHVRYIAAKHWWQNSKWELLKEYKSANGDVTVPIGFISDGASIPIFLKKYFSSTGRYFGAAIIHDYILASADPQPASKEVWHYANNEFKSELKALDITAWRIWIILNGVRVWAVIRTNIIDKYLLKYKFW